MHTSDKVQGFYFLSYHLEDLSPLILISLLLL